MRKFAIVLFLAILADVVPQVAPGVPKAPDVPKVAVNAVAKAKAVITLADGTEVPKTWPLGKPLILSTEKSVAGSIHLSVAPESLLDLITQFDKRFSIGTGLEPVDAIFRFTVAKDDTLDESVIKVRFVKPEPTPKVDPPKVDPPKVDPVPDPIGQSPVAVIRGRSSIPAGSDIFLDASSSISDPPSALKWKWKGTGNKPPFVVFREDTTNRPAYLFLSNPPPGSYCFALIAQGKDKDNAIVADADVIIVTVGPPTPTPPTPTPPPTPPTPPTPTPDPVTKPRILVLYESSDPLTREQSNILNSTNLRTYLSLICMQENNLPAWRFWDKDIDTSNESLGFQTAMTAAKSEATPLPKIVIFNDTKLVKAIPLTSSEVDILTTLKTFGGR